LKIESLTLPLTLPSVTLPSGKLKIESLTLPFLLPFHLKAGKLKIESLTLPSLTLPFHDPAFSFT